MDGKKLAGEKAAEYVKNGMVVGLGTGSTVYWTIMKLGELVRGGLQIQGVPTSRRTEELATELGIPLLDLAEVDEIDLTIDGADEADADLNLIKGGGGALLREKLVASASRRLLIVADESKWVPALGKFPLPVEVVPFGWELTRRQIGKLDCDPILRMADEAPYVTDNGNYILDCHFGVIQGAERLSAALNQLPGVVENGLFVKMAERIVLGFTDGSVEERLPKSK
ncbi:ribose-5-phosphate isomerase RpiA [Paenibacillus harenae]|uniref:Ribose-5-phosphate isomerase A n=1 Tax=Paenibacillus harenae TaxID=306543 RepID=A0ABT9U3F9_PAEHA|nr:ribose-5-phosphate isomerase RpiA [Paenibacillus harenae]MDQ0114166.1 ribose 5-phosphate isomerase A [Paenibacillus harenae]